MLVKVKLTCVAASDVCYVTVNSLWQLTAVDVCARTQRHRLGSVAASDVCYVTVNSLWQLTAVDVFARTQHHRLRSHQHHFLVSFVFTWISLGPSLSCCHDNLHHLMMMTMLLMMMVQWGIYRSTCRTARPKSSILTGSLQSLGVFSLLLLLTVQRL